MSTKARSNNNASQAAHAKPATSQWFRMMVPSSGHVSWFHIGKQSPATGYPGISMSTEANFYVSVVSRSHFQSGGPAVFQSVGEWNQFSLAPMTLWTGSAMNVQATGGVVISSVAGASAAELSVVPDQGKKVPTVATAKQFGDARKTLHDGVVDKVKNWVSSLGDSLGSLLQESGLVNDANTSGNKSLKDTLNTGLLDSLKNLIGLGTSEPDDTSVEAEDANEPGPTSNSGSAAGAISSRASEDVFDLGTVAEGRPIAAGGLSSKIEVKKVEAPAGVAVMSDDQIFMATKKLHCSVAEGGFAFLAPDSARFHVVAGDKVDIKAGARVEAVAAQSATLEGGAWAEMVGGNRATVLSRNTTYVAGPTVTVGARSNTMSAVLGDRKQASNEATKTVVVEAEDSGKISIHMDQGQRLIEIVKDKITVKFKGNTLELSDSGISIKSDKEISMEAPTVKINGTQKIEMSSMQTKIDSDLEVAAKKGGKLEVTMGVVADGGGKLSVQAGMIKNL